MFLGQWLDSSSEVGPTSISQFDYVETLSFFFGTNCWEYIETSLRPS